MHKNPLKIMFIGDAFKDELFKIIITQTNKIYPGCIELRHCRNKDFHLSRIPLYCNADLLVFNWEKFAFIVASFIRQFPNFPAKLILDSGVICDEKWNFQKIMNFGIFDYFISKVNPRWTEHNWEVIIKELSKKPRREKLVCDNAIGHLLYRWRFLPVRANISYRNQVRRQILV